MNKARQLFLRRKAINDKEIAHYSKYIFNGHFVIFLTIAFGALMMQYSQLLKHLPDNINYNLIIGIILALFTVTPLRTYMRSADSIFLLNFERNMNTYFKYAIIKSGTTRILLFIIISIILTPLYMERTASVIGLICAVAIGIWMIYSGLIMRYYMMKLSIERIYISLLIFLMSLSSIYCALEGIASITVTILLLSSGYIYLLKKNAEMRLLDFEGFIDYEHERYQSQNKIINMFTDVKGMKDKAKRRRYMDVLLPRKSTYTQKHMFEFLFIRNFVRSSDNMWIIIRLVIIGCLMMWLIHEPIVAMIIGMFFCYAIVMQVSQFYKMQAFSLWPKVWPTPEQLVLKGFKQFMLKLCIVTTTIFAIMYIILYPAYFYYVIFMYVILLWTINNVTKKIEKRMKLLRD